MVGLPNPYAFEVIQKESSLENVILLTTNKDGKEVEAAKKAGINAAIYTTDGKVEFIWI